MNTYLQLIILILACVGVVGLRFYFEIRRVKKLKEKEARDYKRFTNA